MACLVNDFASFDTPEDPGGASIVERKDFQAKRPLCNAYKLMCFDRNINGNRDVKFLECDYLLVQRCVKLTLVVLRSQNHHLIKLKTLKAQILGPLF